MDNWTSPPLFAVFMHKDERTSRVGNYATLEKARKAIVDSEENRRDTLGGLIPPCTGKARYSIWSAVWSKVE